MLFLSFLLTNCDFGSTINSKSMDPANKTLESIVELIGNAVVPQEIKQQFMIKLRSQVSQNQLSLDDLRRYKVLLANIEESYRSKSPLEIEQERAQQLEIERERAIKEAEQERARQLEVERDIQEAKIEEVKSKEDTKLVDNNEDSSIPVDLSNGQDYWKLYLEGIVRENKKETLKDFILANQLDYNNKVWILNLIISSGTKSMLDMLLKNGFDLNAIEEPLYMAIFKNNVSVAFGLLNNSNKNSQFKDGHTPLTLAISNRNHAMVKLLISRSVDINLPMHSRQYGKKYPIEIAALAFDEEILLTLLDNKATIPGGLIRRLQSSELSFISAQKRQRVIDLIISRVPK